MPYKLILFDADETLFDFAQGEVAAFKATMSPHIGDLPLEKVFERYKKISRKLWSRVEKGKATNTYLKVERFRRLKRLYKLKVDAKVLSEQYLDHLSQQSILLPGAEALCRELRKNYRLGIVTNGIEQVQRRRLAESPLKDLFDFMVVSEECGFAKPDPRIFKYTLEKALHTEIESVLMVGDRLEADIAGAIGAGISSCWYNPKKYSRTTIVPTFEIHSLDELLHRLESIKNNRFWEKNAKAWTQALESKAIASRSVTGPAILAEIKKHQPTSVLDIGCGEGWMLAPLSEQGINYFGIDGSSGLIETAKKQAAKKFEDGKFEDGKFEDEKFEQVSYEQIITGEWQPPHPVDTLVFNFSLLEENTLPLLRAVKQYGAKHLLIQTLNPRAASKDEWQVEDFKSMGGIFEGTMPWYRRTLDSWLDLFKQAGYQVEEMVEPVYENKPASMIFILKP